MSDWLPVLVLPNLDVREPIGTENIQFVRAVDPRVNEVVTEEPNLGEFIRRFTDAFGAKLVPTVLIIRKDTPYGFKDVSAIAGFRDAVSFSTIAGGRALHVGSDSAYGYPNWSETFDFYTWMLSRYGEHLIAQTPAMMGTHDVRHFGGQTTPGLPQVRVEPSHVDGPIFDEIMRRWARRFGDGEVSWEDRALFRSLNMARSAMMMPGGVEYGFYDVGRLITLWISAFEILLHPGPGGGVGETQVLDLLDAADWLDDRCREKVHPVKVGKSPAVDRTLASSLYHRIYALRNDFLHGNEVTADKLATESEAPLLLVASSLYRAALATFLQLKIPPIGDDADDDAIVRYINTLTYWKGPMRMHERAILKAAGLPEKDDL